MEGESNVEKTENNVSQSSHEGGRGAREQACIVLVRRGDGGDLAAACGLGGVCRGCLSGGLGHRRRDLGDRGAVGEEDGDGFVFGKDDTTGHDGLWGSFQIAEVLQTCSNVVGALEVVDGGVEVVSFGVVHHLEDIEFTGTGVPRGAITVDWILGGSWDVCVQQPDGRHVVPVGLILRILFGHVGWGPELKKEHLVDAIEAVVGLTVGSVRPTVVLALTLDVRGDGHFVCGGDGDVVEDLRLVGKLEAIGRDVVDGVTQTCVLLTVVSQKRDVVRSALLRVVVRLPLPAAGTGAERVRVGDVVAELPQVEGASQVDGELFVQGSQRTGENERAIHVLLARTVAVVQGLDLRHRVVVPEVADVVELQEVGWRGAGLGGSGVDDAEAGHRESECGEFAEHGCCVCFLLRANLCCLC